MENILKSMAGKTEDKCIASLLDPEKKDLISPQEKEVLQFMYDSYKNSGIFPSVDMISSKFVEYKIPLEKATVLSDSDIKVEYSNLIKTRQNLNTSRKLMQIASDVTKNGISYEQLDEIRSCYDIGDSEADVVDNTNSPESFKEFYNQKKNQPVGLLTYIKQIDNAIGGIGYGMMANISAFTASFKCVSENERIVTESGLLTMKEIYDRISHGKEVGKVLSEEGMRNISAVHNEGFKPTKVIYVRGKRIETSLTHKFRVFRGASLEWVEAKDLKVGDQVAVTFRNPEVEFKDKSKDLDRWYLLGVLTRSGQAQKRVIKKTGYQTGWVYVQLESSKFESLKLADLFNEFTSHVRPVRSFGKETKYSRIGTSIRLFNMDISCLYNKYRHEVSVPDSIWTTSVENIKSYLAGIFEPTMRSWRFGRLDRDYIFMATKSFRLAQDISRLLSLFGILSIIDKIDRSTGALYQLRISPISRDRFIDEIPLRFIKLAPRVYQDYINTDLHISCRGKGRGVRRVLEEKYGRSFFTRTGRISRDLVREYLDEFPECNDPYHKEVLENDLTYQRVTGIEDSQGYLYDLTVEGSPTYVINSVVTHNTTFATNIAYHNTMENKYNICYVSLEVPKEDMMFNLLSRHSLSTDFDKFDYISSKKMRDCNMSPDEEDYLFNTILPDFYDLSKHGMIKILDETDFNTLSFSEIREKLYQVDDEMKQKTGYGLDAVVIDHVNLLKFNGSKTGKRFSSETAEGNAYISFFRKLGISFRKDDKGNMRKLMILTLAQLNRQGYNKACKNKGKYNLTSLAEFNELERGSQVVITIFTNPEMKEAKEATVQLLKNRNGITIEDPISVYADGETYCFGDEDEGFNASISSGDMDELFDSNDLDSLGI